MPADLRVYLDHAATTPMVPAAVEALIGALSPAGNSSSLHASGRRSKALLEDAREGLAAAVGAHPSEVVFTSGGTEADNLAIAGTYAARTREEPAARGIVTSSIEHHAVLEPTEALVAAGAHVVHAVADTDGIISADSIADALEVLRTRSVRPALVSVMWANNEIGTIQPVAAIADLAQENGAQVHSDAVQAVGRVPLSFRDSGLHLLSLSGHKLGGPMGVGALVVARDAVIEPVVHGGGHERGLRSGTVPVPLAAALAAAVSHAVSVRKEESSRRGALRDRLIEGLLGLDLDLTVGGAWTPGSAHDRLPGNVHIIVPGCDADSLLFLLDAAGIEASTGSACQAGVPGRSHVLDAIGVSTDQPVGAVRLTLGHTSTGDDVERAISAVRECVPRARAAAGVLA